MNIVIIVQARMESTRFPGKVLALLHGQPMILWQLARLRDALPQYACVVAVPETAANDVLIETVKRHGYVSIAVNGDPSDVLARYHRVATVMQADVVVRVTGDCPLLDGALVRQVLDTHLRLMQQSQIEYTALEGTWPEGQDVEVINAAALARADRSVVVASDREHVTPWLFRTTGACRCDLLPCPFDLRWMQYSVDTPADLALVSDLMRKLLPQYGVAFTWRDIWLTTVVHPTLAERMRARGARNRAYTTQVAAEQGLGTVPEWDTLRYGDDRAARV